MYFCVYCMSLLTAFSFSFSTTPSHLQYLSFLKDCEVCESIGVLCTTQNIFVRRHAVSQCTSHKT